MDLGCVGVMWYSIAWQAGPDCQAGHLVSTTFTILNFIVPARSVEPIFLKPLVFTFFSKRISHKIVSCVIIPSASLVWKFLHRNWSCVSDACEFRERNTLAGAVLRASYLRCRLNTVMDKWQCQGGHLAPVCKKKMF